MKRTSRFTLCLMFWSLLLWRPGFSSEEEQFEQNNNKPNILLIVTDQERYPPHHTPPNVKEWIDNLPGKRRLNDNTNGGQTYHFVSHRTSATACSPSRGSLYTGHVVDVHGVSQTYGLAKTVNDPSMSWLHVKDVPTMGDYFRAGGYDTFYIGKWHISFEDIFDSDDYIVEDPSTYQQANKLDKFGWDRWLGPEPHGASFANTGWERDPGYVQQFESFLKERQQQVQQQQQQGNNTKPWVVALNLVNPHDICLSDITWRLANRAPLYDDDTPPMPLPPTLFEDLTTKPAIQKEYTDNIQNLLARVHNWEDYRRFYLFLMKRVDQHIDTVLKLLEESVFADTTIRAHTADHGDLQGEHSGMIQKWHNGYEETLHIPFVIHDPRRQSINSSSSSNNNNNRVEVDVPTQSLDILPTLLSLTGLDATELQNTLKKTHQEVHPLPGRDLSPLMSGTAEEQSSSSSAESVFKVATNDNNDAATGMTYFQMKDQISRGEEQESLIPKVCSIVRLLGNWKYNALGETSPSHIEGIVFKRASDNHTIKFLRYYDDPEFWSEPGVQDVRVDQTGFFQLSFLSNYGKKTIKTQKLPDVYEVYDLTVDPIEVNNLAYSKNNNGDSSSDDESSTATASLIAELLQHLEVARKRYKVQRNQPLPPVSERNAHLPTHVHEHSDTPIIFHILTYGIVIFVYSFGLGLLYIMRRILLSTAEEQSTKGSTKLKLN